MAHKVFEIKKKDEVSSSESDSESEKSSSEDEEEELSGLCYSVKWKGMDDKRNSWKTKIWCEKNAPTQLATYLGKIAEVAAAPSVSVAATSMSSEPKNVSKQDKPMFADIKDVTQTSVKQKLSSILADRGKKGTSVADQTEQLSILRRWAAEAATVHGWDNTLAAAVRYVIVVGSDGHSRGVSAGVSDVIVEGSVT